jgi:FkbM family methyltransferase
MRAGDLVVRLSRPLLSRSQLQLVNRLLFRVATAGMGVGCYDTSLFDERNFLRRIRGHLRYPPTVFDVGANRGQYAELILSALPGVRLFSFEPHPVAYASLKRAMRSRPNVTAVNAALGSSCGTATLFDYADAGGSEHASLVPGIIEDIHGGTSVKTEVTSVTLDAFIERIGVAFIDLLKIDVEGAEAIVLRGAQASIASGKIGVVQMEFNEMNAVSRTFVGDLSTLLPRHRLFRILRNGDLLDLSGMPPLRRELFGYQNLVALPELRPARA